MEESFSSVIIFGAIMELQTVRNRKDLRAFIQFPYDLYRDDPLWIAPLRSEQWAQFDPKKNPMLDHCETELFLLKDKGKVIGRCSAFIDRLAEDYCGKPFGLFGSYECIEVEEATHMLLSAAKDWLIKRGMKSMRGPWSFTSREWGRERGQVEYWMRR